MASRLPKAARTYLAQLDSALAHLEAAERDQILASTAARIRALPGRGRRPSEIISVLGPVEALGRNFEKVQPEALQVRSGLEFLTRILAWPTFAFALLTAVVLLLAPPATEHITAALFTSADSVSFGYIESSGWRGWINTDMLPVALAALAPALFSLTPLILPGRGAMFLLGFGAVLLSVAAVLAGPGIGPFFLPVIILLWTQLIVPPVLISRSMGRAGVIWRMQGTVYLLVVLALASYPYIVSDSGVDLLAAGLAVVLAVPVLAHLMRWWWAEMALIALGLVIIIVGVLTSLALVTPWLVGGLFFIVGHLGLAGNMWHRRSANLLALL